GADRAPFRRHQKSDHDFRSYRRGRRSDFHAGHLRVRSEWDRRNGESKRDIPSYGNSTEICRAPGHVRGAAASRAVRVANGDLATPQTVMIGLIALLVFIVVAVLVFAVGSLFDERSARARLLRE